MNVIISPKDYTIERPTLTKKKKTKSNETIQRVDNYFIFGFICIYIYECMTISFAYFTSLLPLLIIVQYCYN